MTPLSLETFVKAGQDAETNQYRILNGLKHYREEFTHNRIYPALADLISLLSVLQSLVQESSTLEQKLPQHIAGVDLATKKLHLEPAGLNSPDLKRILDLIEWAIPHLKTTIEEGIRIYDFVDENIAVEEVGILPMYREEGYYFVPEHQASLLHLLKYETSLYSAGNERFRALKTNILRSIPQSAIQESPESIKLRLIEEHHDLPNPATFLCETELDFPFSETILPVAKRKLMVRVFS
ncbi:MAG: hypothetical protein HYW57_06425 [Ignavibacteriales bacterium]|nr:hypothetical protein [Ignavibacteriales bacterium]